MNSSMSIRISQGFSLVQMHKLEKTFQSLHQIRQKIPTLLEKKIYDSPEDFIRLPFDTTIQKEINEFTTQKKMHIDVLVLIGIGGSSAATKAIYEALVGLKIDGIHKKSPEFLCADTIDPVSIAITLQALRKAVCEGKELFAIIVSKSGKTIETQINAQLIFDTLQEICPHDYQDRLLLISDAKSPLEDIALKIDSPFFAIPPVIGGRFSAFSVAGLFPLALLKVDIDSLLAGARAAVDILTRDIHDDPAAHSAVFIYEHYTQHNFLIHELFIFSTHLQGFSAWWRQLIGESLGKNSDIFNTAIGLYPGISTGTLDLHSVAQLYLGGLPIATTTFLTIDSFSSKIKVNTGIFLNDTSINKSLRELGSIMNSIATGVMKSYQDAARPFIHLEIPELTPYWLGFLLQLKMIELSYLAYLFGVNAFNQPHVELYKQHAQRILRNG